VNLWLKPDWERGYEKGRKAGIEETEARIIAALERYVGMSGFLGLSQEEFAALIKGEAK
jgi:hypothetical protein